jgi:hypothetical protein
MQRNRRNRSHQKREIEERLTLNSDKTIQHMGRQIKHRCRKDTRQVVLATVAKRESIKYMYSARPLTSCLTFFFLGQHGYAVKIFSQISTFSLIGQPPISSCVLIINLILSMLYKTIWCCRAGPSTNYTPVFSLSHTKMQSNKAVHLCIYL